VASRASSPPGGFAASRIRWAVLGAAVLLGIGIGAGLIIARAPGKAKPLPLLGGPAAAWTAGARPAPAFSLTDENGKAVSLAAYRGRPVILTFLDPLCRNYCPVEARRLSALERSLPRSSRPAIVAVSVNIYGNAKRYLIEDKSKWDVTRDWRWGIGKPAQLAAVWRHYDIGVTVTSKKLAGVNVRNVIHTEAAYVIDAKGDERALFLWPFRAADVGAALRGLN
jgi:cytochrome oxidase Cu insertion factor (SCO1/SenC/PrrC family)